VILADDIKLYHTIHSFDDCVRLQNHINILLDWPKHWLLSFIISKCKVLHVGNTPYTGNYTVAGTLLELLDTIQDLGIQINSKLKFHTHTDMVVTHMLGLICKSFECKNSDAIAKLYKTIVCPIIEYNNVIWGPFLY